jgi:hypothetical protein
MDSYTPGWACITACVIVLIALLGTPLVEAIVGQKYRPFDPLDAARIAGVPTWWAVLWLFIVGILVAVAQLAFVAALLDSTVAPITKLIAAIELALLVAWIVAMLRFARGRTG